MSSKLQMGGVMMVMLLGLVFSFGTSWVSAEEQKKEGVGDVQERAIPRMSPGMEPGILTPLPTPSAPAGGTGGTSSVVAGVLEPDYRYPWVVRMGGCGGVLIDPQWVLTAAHCVTPGIGFGNIFYKRTDPYTGAEKTETRAPFPQQRPNSGVYIHPNYNPQSDHANDIALILLAQPFTLNPYIQTAGLPRSPRSPGMVGTVASISHTGPLPAGQVAVFRGPISQLASPTKIMVTAASAMASLCQGDSGSGFVTFEGARAIVNGGRAIVRGIASQGTVSTCMTPSGEAVFTDVFMFRDWILQTMGKTDATLVGNTRVRWSGRGARGVMLVACFNPYGNLEGPLNVVGVEVGAVCEAGQTQTVMCRLEKDQGNVKPVTMPTLSGITVRTTSSNGTSQVQTIPASGNTASLFGLLPAGASRELTCQIGTPFTAPITGTNAAVMSRGIEGESAAEPTVEQPSPFDQPGNSTVNIQLESTPAPEQASGTKGQ